jgi:hypothetical protein
MKYKLKHFGNINIAATAVLLYTSAAVYAGPFQHTLTIDNPTPAAGDIFANSTGVAIDGDRILLGAVNDDTAGTNAGAAYLFDATNGQLLHSFINPNVSPTNQFAEVVSISGNRVLIGDREDDSVGSARSGAAYLYNATTGQLEHTFTDPTGGAFNAFGRDVSVFEDRVLIGAVGDDTGAFNSGVAYLYDADTGALLHQFINPTPQASDAFGYGLTMNDESIVITAMDDNTGASESGSIYVYDANTYALRHTITNPTPGAQDRFGQTVAIEGDKIVVSSPHDDTGASNSGAAYVFSASTGQLLHSLLNPTPDADDGFGATVDISGNTIVIGTNVDDTLGLGAGAAHVFDAISGDLIQTILNPTLQVPASFGLGLGISGDRIVLGATGHIVNGVNAGGAFVFERTASVPEPKMFLIFGACLAGLFLVRPPKRGSCPGIRTARRYS